MRANRSYRGERLWAGVLAVALGVPAGGAWAGEERGPLLKGEPFPGFGRRMPYEEVLDRSDLVLAGKVTRQVAPRLVYEKQGPVTIPGEIHLDVQRVLLGEHAGRTAVITFGNQAIADLADTNKVFCFLCMRPPGGLCLTGDPPDGGGFMPEGPELAEKLIQAARDPAKGYEAQDAVVKLSAACRLAQLWTDTPAEKRPPPPPRLVETLMEGLTPSDLHGPNVNATARDAVNSLFACDLNAIWSYSVRHSRGKRTKEAKEVRAGWERTIEAVQKRRAERANRPDPLGPEAQARIARLVEKLGSDDYPQEQAAREELLRIGRPALRLVRAGVTNENAKVAQGCRLLADLIGKLRDYRPANESYVFDLDRAEPFVPPAAQQPTGPAPPDNAE